MKLISSTIILIPESELVNYYSKAKVFVLLSKDEGLALVQPQAVACGLPLVITKHTGGDDLITIYR
ncbi:MAG: glycosyltransferase [Phocaeicola vulgatus]